MSPASSYLARVRGKSRQGNAAIQPLRTYIDLYLADKAAANRQPSYILDLRNTLQRFDDFLAGELEREPTLEDFSLDTARAFALFEQERRQQHHVFGEGVVEIEETLSSVTVRKNLRTIKVFSSWLYKEDWTSSNILAKLDLPKAAQKEVQPLTKDEELRLARGCDERTKDGCRRLALLLLYLDTGARLAEIANLRVEDVDFARGMIHIQPTSAKGRKGRSANFGRKTESVMRRYGIVFRHPPITEARNEDYFFLNPAGDPVTENGIYQMFRRLAVRTGVKRLHPHLLRHTSATRDLELGKSTREVQHKLGHSSVSVTERYVHIMEREKDLRRRDSHIDELPLTIRKGRRLR